MRNPLLYGRCKSALHGPSMSEPLNQSVLFHPQFPRPLRDGKRLSVKRDQCIASTVVILVNRRCPPAIFGRVPGVVVNSVQGHAVRPVSHVGQEILKFHPSLANIYSSTAVPGVVPMVRIQAPLFHCGPRLIGRRFSPIGGMTMPSIPDAVLAMASLDISSSDMGDKALPLLATKGTTKKPFHVPVEVNGIAKKSEVPELCPRLNKFGFRHASHRRIIAFMGNTGAGYGQPERKLAALEHAYSQAGGTFA